MLFKKRFWDGLADGSITLAFRRWKRPTVKAGGTLRSPGGFLAIDSAEMIGDDDLDDDLARRAGYADLAALLKELGPPTADRVLYRIEFHVAGPDPRDTLRTDAVLTDDDVAELCARLARLDRAAPKPWTAATLRAIADQPAVVSTSLAEQLGMERAAFKLNVRKLKALGLTESLEIGYRLSPRGEAFRASGSERERRGTSRSERPVKWERA
jgi:biotin operon repressor